MDLRRSIFITGIASIFLFLCSGFCLGEKAILVSPAPLYSQMSSGDAPIELLEKGSSVDLEFEVAGPEGIWCAVSQEGGSGFRGYTDCRYLQRDLSSRARWRTGGQRPEAGLPAVTSISLSGNSVLVPVKLGYKDRSIEAVLLLDTGASRTMINTETAARLGIEQTDTTRAAARGIGGIVVESAVARLSFVNVGPYTAEDLLVHIIRDRGPGLKHDGLLGMDFLRGKKYYIDFKNKVINWSFEGD